MVKKRGKDGRVYNYVDKRAEIGLVEKFWICYGYFMKKRL